MFQPSAPRLSAASESNCFGIWRWIHKSLLLPLSRNDSVIDVLIWMILRPLIIIQCAGFDGLMPKWPIREPLMWLDHGQQQQKAGRSLYDSRSTTINHKIDRRKHELWLLAIFYFFYPIWSSRSKFFFSIMLFGAIDAVNTSEPSAIGKWLFIGQQFFWLHFIYLVLRFFLLVDVFVVLCMCWRRTQQRKRHSRNTILGLVDDGGMSKRERTQQ